jgi:hydrogenase-4 component F
VTDLVPALVVAMLALPIGAAILCAIAPGVRAADRINIGAAALTAAAAVAVAATVAVDAPHVARGGWYVVDGTAAVFVAVAAVVGLAGALLSPAYLRHAGRSWFSASRSRGWYYAAFYLFWAALLAVPIADNLAIAWLLIEATTATSALLVGFSGKPSALEAGWKYVVLTTLGLAVALLGIVVLYIALGAAPSGLGRLDWDQIARGATGVSGDAVIVSFVLVIVGLATKIGLAPVHNWLPDAHSEAPPPVSAMLSAALLPTVLLVAWRVRDALAPAVGTGAVRSVLLALGVCSLAVAVPFLWRPLPWKRLLAYSSLEHMGVLAIGVAIGGPLATAGVLLHVAGHAVAKALGFFAAIPLLRHDPQAADRPATGVALRNRPTALAMGVSLAVLAGLPPGPLFASELMILLAVIDAGLLPVAVVAALLLALGFLGLAHAFLEALLGEPRSRRVRSVRSSWTVGAMAVGASIALLAMAALAFELPDAALVREAAGGLR